VDLDAGTELLVETARLWISLGHHGRDGHWHIAGVTGPDEYTAITTDNSFTNLAAASNLNAAAAAVGRHPDLGQAFGVDATEVATWRAAADTVHLPYDTELGVHQQSENFTHLPEWDFTLNQDYPLLLHAPYFDLYRSQVIKQADLELAMYWFSDRFTPQERARNVDYYERRTVRDSSLSACIQAVLAAEVGHLDLAHDYTYEAASIDLRDLHHDTRDGLHIASLAGTWTALVAGFGGMRQTCGTLTFDPLLPPGLTRLRFSVRWRGRLLDVDLHPQHVTYSLRATAGAAGDALRFRHADTETTLTHERPLTLPIKERRPLMTRPAQPPGREPVSRAEHRGGTTSGR
jgi:alpha,alpha-trehalose phosphorylase